MAETQDIASLSVSTLIKMRTGQSSSCTKEEPVLPRIRKLPRCLDNSSADNNFFSGTAEDWHKVAYFEILDLVIEAIKRLL